jgi:hypothetical protein
VPSSSSSGIVGVGRGLEREMEIYVLECPHREDTSWPNLPSVVTLIMILSVYPMTRTSTCWPFTCLADCFIRIIGDVGSIRTDTLSIRSLLAEAMNGDPFHDSRL